MHIPHIPLKKKNLYYYFILFYIIIKINLKKKKKKVKVQTYGILLFVHNFVDCNSNQSIIFINDINNMNTKKHTSLTV